MKALICGLGSIGQRHVRIIGELFGDNAQIAACRQRNRDIVISDRLEAATGTKPEEYYKILSFSKLDEALAWKPDAVFVTNPISLHVETALIAAAAGCNLFIEKPLNDNQKGTQDLLRLVRAKNLVCMIGYQLRYHPAYVEIKALLEERALGRLVSADLHFGEWLPGMHPYEDYRESHAARKDQGGGVILCLSHEIDIAYWLFGEPVKVHAQGGHLSDLEIDVEDTADILLDCSDSGRNFPVHIHLDFLQKPPRRYIHIVGDRGNILFDYFTCELVVNLQASQERKSFKEFQRNDMFRIELRAFFESVEKGTPAPIPLEQGIDVLNICLAARESMMSGLTVKI